MRSQARRAHLRWAFASALLVSAIALSGCSSYYLGEDAPELTKKAVIGPWIHHGPAGVTASVTLRADGSFVETDIPQISTPSTADIQSGKVKDDTIVDWSKVEDGSGTWSIHDDSDGSAPAVDLDYAVADNDLVKGPIDGGEYFSLLSLAVAGSPRLFFVAGDADLKYRFLLRKK